MEHLLIKMDIIEVVMNTVELQKKDGFIGEQVCILPEEIKKELRYNELCKNLFLTDIGFYPDALFHNRIRESGCNQYILIYCVRGEGWYEIEDCIYKLKANQFIVLPKNTPHEYGSSLKNPWSIFWVHFDGNLSERYFHFLFANNLLQPRMVIPSENRDLLFYTILSFATMINNKDAIIYANNCLYNYLISFKSSVFSSKETIDHTNQVIRDCITLMKKNLDKNLNLFELSQIMNLSVSYISSLFKERVHDSPYDYYIFLKMQRACYLIWNSGKKIKSIAEDLGYEDPYHFSRVFTRVMGISPRAFRKRRER